MNRLVVEGLDHAYDAQPVLRAIAFAVEPGEIVCLLGPSGCGKTTLLRLIAGLEAVQAGAIAVGDAVVADSARSIDLAPERRGVGQMFQDYALFPHLTVRENVTFGLGAQGQAGSAWADGALARMGLRHHADRYPHALSGGQQQRVALLRALAPRPRVLLLDEPFSGLDVTLRAQVREETLDLLKETGVTVLMVTHDPEEAMFMADRILVMNEGRIVQVGTPAEVYFRPANAFVARHFGPCNWLAGRIVGGRVATDFGTFAAPGLAEGARARVMIRPEGLRLAPCADPDAPEHRVRVVSARLIGRASLLRLRWCAPAGAAAGREVILQARVPGTFMPPQGTPVAVEVDEGRVHVFAADDNGAEADDAGSDRADV